MNFDLFLIYLRIYNFSIYMFISTESSIEKFMPFLYCMKLFATRTLDFFSQSDDRKSTFGLRRGIKLDEIYASTKPYM
jgi:hypothetical protein